MSCYEWEGGSIKIPSKVWAKFRSKVIKYWNTIQLKEYEDLVYAFEKLKVAGKGKRGKNRKEAQVNELYRLSKGGLFPRERYGYFYTSLFFGTEVANQNDYYPSSSISQRSLSKPKKNGLDIRKTSEDQVWYIDEATLRLENSSQMLEWRVSENNRSVSRAHQNPFL